MSIIKQITNLLPGESVVFPLSDLQSTMPTLRTSVSRLAKANHAHYSVKTVGKNIHVVCNRKMGHEWAWHQFEIRDVGRYEVLLKLFFDQGGWWYNMPHKDAPKVWHHITDGTLSEAAKFCEEAVSKYLIERERKK